MICLEVDRALMCFWTRIRNQGFLLGNSISSMFVEPSGSVQYVVRNGVNVYPPLPEGIDCERYWHILIFQCGTLEQEVVITFLYTVCTLRERVCIVPSSVTLATHAHEWRKYSLSFYRSPFCGEKPIVLFLLHVHLCPLEDAWKVHIGRSAPVYGYIAFMIGTSHAVYPTIASQRGYPIWTFFVHTQAFLIPWVPRLLTFWVRICWYRHSRPMKPLWLAYTTQYPFLVATSVCEGLYM